MRRIPHPGRGVTATRTRRANMHFQSAGGSTLSGLSPASRETMDPIAGKLNSTNTPGIQEVLGILNVQGLE